MSINKTLCEYMNLLDDAWDEDIPCILSPKESRELADIIRSLAIQMARLERYKELDRAGGVSRD